jgi:hypothetical protein
MISLCISEHDAERALQVRHRATEGGVFVAGLASAWVVELDQDLPAFFNVARMRKNT